MNSTDHSKMHNHRHALNRKILNGLRRFLSLVLSVCLSICGIPSVPILAETIDNNDDVQEFTLSGDDIYDALETALSQGKTVNPSDYIFSGAEQEAYEELFYDTADVYELYPEFESDEDGKLRLKVFARLDCDRILDSVDITEEDQIIFLLLNHTDEEIMARIYIDEYETGLIKVAPKTELNLIETVSLVQATKPMGVSTTAMSAGEVVSKETANGVSADGIEDIEENDKTENENDKESSEDFNEIDDDTIDDSYTEDVSSDNEEDITGDSNEKDAKDHKYGTGTRDALGSLDKSSDSKDFADDNDPENSDDRKSSDKHSSFNKNESLEKKNSSNDKDKPTEGKTSDGSDISGKRDSSRDTDKSESSNDNGADPDNSNSNSKESEEHDSIASIAIHKGNLLSANAMASSEDEKEIPEIVIETENINDKDNAGQDSEVKVENETSDNLQENIAVEVASYSDWNLASASDAGYTLLDGELFDSVIVNGNRSGVAFVCSLNELIEDDEEQLYTYEDENVAVSVLLPADTNVPKSAILEVVAVTEEDNEYDYEELFEQAESVINDGQVANILFYDISFYTLEDEYINVEDTAQVVIKFKDSLLSSDNTIHILHYTEGDDNPIDITGLYKTGDGEGNLNTVNFETDGFSVFGIADVMPLDAGDAGLYINAATVNLSYSGEAPFDNDDTDGNDSSATNDIIRSFDRAGYEMILDINRQNGSSDATDVRVHFNIYIQGSDIENSFYEKGLIWVSHYEITEKGTGHIIEGYYDYHNDSGVSVGQISGLNIVIQTLAMSDGMILQPTGIVWLEEMEGGNGTGAISDVVDLEFPALEVSARLQLNVYLYTGAVAQTAAEGIFNFSSGDEDYINYDKGTSIDGRLYGYGLALEMYTTDSNRGMKGQALPDGEEIDLSVSLNSTYKVGSMTYNLGEFEGGNYQLLFYALEGNTNKNEVCADGRSLVSTDGYYPSEYYCNHIPYNVGTSSQLGVTGVEDGGDWKAISQIVDDGGTTVNIQVKNYQITKLLFPYAYPNNSNATDSYIFYTKGLEVQDIDKAAVFSGGELWVIQPYTYTDNNGTSHALKTDAGEGTFSIQVNDGVKNGTAGTYVNSGYDSYDNNIERDSNGKIIVNRGSDGDIEYGSKQTKSIDTQVYSSDDTSTRSIDINLTASLSNKIKYISTGSKNAYTNVQKILGDTSGTSYSPIGYDDVSIAGGLQYTPNTKSNISAALNAMIKFDAAALSIKDSSWLSFLRSDGLSSTSGNYSIFFGYLPSGGNWESDDAMQAADEDDVDWYSERQSDKLCVAVLFEYRRPGTTTGDTRLRPGIAMNVLADTTLAGNVYMTCEVTRLWTVENIAALYNKDEDNIAEGRSITYNDVLNDTDGSLYIKNYIPSVADNYGSTANLPAQDFGYGSGGSYNTKSNGTKYTKSVYGTDGKTGGHNGSDAYGDSLLILGYTSNVDIGIAQEAKDQQTGGTVAKSIFSFDNAERVADIVVTGSMKVQQSASTDWGTTTATITVTIPNGATYEQGSAKYGIADSSGNFDITYTQPTTMGQQGTVNDGLDFTQTNNKDIYDAWLTDENEKGGIVYISTDTSGNTVLTFSVKEVPVQSTDVLKIYFSVVLGDESNINNDLKANDYLIFDAIIHTVEDYGREISSANGNEDSTTIYISKTGSNTFSKYALKALNEVSDDLSWIIQWDNTSQSEDMMEILDDMPDKGEAMGAYSSVYNGTYEITGFAIDTSYIKPQEAQEYLKVYATTDAAYEGEKLVTDGDEEAGGDNKEITWEEISKSWTQLSIADDGTVDFSTLYKYEIDDSTEKITGVENHVYSWAIGGYVPVNEGVHITLTIHQYGAEGGDYMTNVAYDSTGNSILHRSATAYRVLRTVSGTVWLDEDLDGGIRTGMYKDEQLLADTDITLEIQNDGNNWEIAEDLYGNECTVKTDDSGNYEFTDLKEGTYRIVFSGSGTSNDKTYQLSDHVLTTKEASGIAVDKNSRADPVTDKTGYILNDPQGVITGITLPSIEDMAVYDYISEMPYQNAGYTKTVSFTVDKKWQDSSGKDMDASGVTDDIIVNIQITDSQGETIENHDFELNSSHSWKSTLENLPYYNGSGELLDYTLNTTVTETKGKDGYTSTIGEIQKLGNNDSEGNVTSITGYSVIVTNRAGFELPKTGGSGSMPFRVAGALIFGGALYLLYLTLRRRRRWPGS